MTLGGVVLRPAVVRIDGVGPPAPSNRFFELSKRVHDATTLASLVVRHRPAGCELLGCASVALRRLSFGLGRVDQNGVIGMFPGLGHIEDLPAMVWLPAERSLCVEFIGERDEVGPR